MRTECTREGVYVNAATPLLVRWSVLALFVATTVMVHRPSRPAAPSSANVEGCPDRAANPGAGDLERARLVDRLFTATTEKERQVVHLRLARNRAMRARGGRSEH